MSNDEYSGADAAGAEAEGTGSEAGAGHAGGGGAGGRGGDRTDGPTEDSAGSNSGADSGGGRREEHRVSGDQLLKKVKDLIHEGNVRRISIRTVEGRTLLEIPLSIGLVGAVLAPTFAAIGTVAALVTSCSIVVERVENE